MKNHEEKREQEEAEKSKRRVASESPRAVPPLRYRGQERKPKFKCPQILVRKQGMVREAGSLQHSARN